MMKPLFTAVALAGMAGLSFGLATAAQAQAVVGQPAPAFTATDSNGKQVSLSDFRGKPVVLEWTNSECPFVQKFYGSGEMQRQQAAARKDGAVWLTINSGASGKQGHINGAQANSLIRSQGASPNAYLLDATGSIGKAYGAKTTPHMYVIKADGTLAYAGGIDDVPSANPADIAKAKPLVLNALAEVKAGKAVTTPTSRPYGCSIKY